MTTAREKGLYRYVYLTNSTESVLTVSSNTFVYNRRDYV